jgi:hypothetical protein
MAENAKTDGQTVAERMLLLFDGNTRSSGRYDLKRDRCFTEEGPLRLANMEDHLSGKMGAGSVPIQDDDNCSWAAIDIDNHHTDEDIPINDLSDLIRTHRLPLIPCRSKSGGAHVYAFLEKPLPAVKVRAAMTKWAGLLGYADAEIFPKQNSLSLGSSGKKQAGNWINLPYFDVEKTGRYAIRDGKKLAIEQFLDLAEKSKVNGKDLAAQSLAEHPEAPPCIQRMMSNGVASGHRNEAIYNVTVYLRKLDPEKAEQKAKDANLTIFTKPLGRAEMTRTIGSALRPDCQYRCKEEPLRSLCDRDTCLTRKHGITPADADRMIIHEELPLFTDLVKYMTEPIRWELRIDGIKVTNVMTPQLLDWRAMREMIADRLTKIVPLIKPGEWERMLIPLMKEARILEVPDDASMNGVIRDRLREFAAKSDLMNRGENKEDRKALIRGLPVVQVMDGERCVVFRGQDFVNYLKRTKSEELKGVNLWFALKDLGLQHCKMRAGDENINVWHIPVSQALNGLTAEPPKFRSEI